MKRFVSIMLVTLLLVGCLSTVAFAEAVDRTATVSFTVSGEFANFKAQVSVPAPLEIVGFSIVGNPANGQVAWTSTANVPSQSFTVTVKLPAGEKCGNYGIGASIISASKTVPVEEDTEDGVANGLVATSVSISGGSASFAHDWGAEVVTPGADCQTKGTKTVTCTICGAENTSDGPMGEHIWDTKWSKDNHNHWHECTVCSEHKDEDKHTWGAGKDTGKRTDDGYEVWGKSCTVCAKYLEYLVHPDVPPTGDITPYGTYNAVFFIAAMFALCCTTGMIFKRKFTK